MRRRDILVDDEAVVEFYDRRIPADVTDVRRFETWWKKAQARDARAAHDDAGRPARRAGCGAGRRRSSPTDWVQGEQRMRLRYRFEPGAEDDGVTVEVPLALLARLRPDGFDRLVPGLREELVTALLKSLPKAIRRNVVPAADWARRLLAELPPAGPDDMAAEEPLADGARGVHPIGDPHRRLGRRLRPRAPARRTCA